MAIGWRPTWALIRAALVTTATVGLSLGLGRADLAALGAPVVLGLIMALSARSPDRSVLPSAVAAPVGDVLSDHLVDLDIRIAGTDGAQFVSVTVPEVHRGVVGGFLTVGGAPVVGVRTLTKAPTWGTVTIARPDLTAAGPDGLWEVGPVVGPELSVAVRPQTGRMDPLELPAIFGGWAGEHVSRRPGQGGDLIDLRELVPGDRLRSIHWRAYARHQKLFVRRTQSDADTEFVLCVDTRQEVRPQSRPPRTGWKRFQVNMSRRFTDLGRFVTGMFAVPAPIPGPEIGAPWSSLDLTVQAASAIAAAQLRAGDRVGVLDLSTYRRHVRLGTGTRHLERIRHQLAALDFSDWPWLVRAELWGLPASAVVVIISPLTDEAVLTAASDCQARGHHVIVVDVLPLGGLRAVARGERLETEELALLMAERDQRLEVLRRRAVPILSFDAGNISTQLSTLRRATRGHR